MKKMLLLLTSFAFSVSASSFTKIDEVKSLNYLLKNIHPEGTVKGVVVASPSKAEPNYFYHWVRDAALVMNTIFDLMIVEKDPAMKEKLENLMFDFVQRVKGNQEASGFWNLGEPKYHVDGAPFTGPWGRPQHDGPGLRAVTLIKFANYLLDQGKVDWVMENLYTPVLPAISPIKMDLEYVALHYDRQGFDYWEEVMGLHFSTAMGQRKALLSGAKLAKRLGDNYAAQYYEAKANKVSELIETFWNEEKGYIESTLDQTRGVWKSQLDISVILGVHHGDNNDLFFSVSDERVMKTAQRLEESFNNIYTINQNRANEDLGTAIGRYPEDSYDGYRTDKHGNPWFLTTFAMGEYYLRLAKELKHNFIHPVSFYCTTLKLKECAKLSESSSESVDSQFINLLNEKAMSFFKRADFHAGDNGHMDEQMSRYNGYMMGARDLTWSYAAHLSAFLQFK